MFSRSPSCREKKRKLRVSYAVSEETLKSVNRSVAVDVPGELRMNAAKGEATTDRKYDKHRAGPLELALQQEAIRLEERAQEATQSERQELESRVADLQEVARVLRRPCE